MIDFPKEFNSDTKIKQLKVLPIIKGYKFVEGHYDNKEIFSSLVDLHDLHSEWIFLHRRRYTVTSLFSTEKEECLVPDKACNVVTNFEEIPFKVGFKNKFDFRSIRNHKE